MLNAPQIIGYDLRQANAEQLALLGHAGLIALNQDAWGNQAVLAFYSSQLQIYANTLADGTKGVAVLNRSSAPVPAVLTAAHLKFAADVPVE